MAPQHLLLTPQLPLLLTGSPPFQLGRPPAPFPHHFLIIFLTTAPPIPTGSSRAIAVPPTAAPPFAPHQDSLQLLLLSLSSRRVLLLLHLLLLSPPSRKVLLHLLLLSPPSRRVLLLHLLPPPITTPICPPVITTLLFLIPILPTIRAILPPLSEHFLLYPNTPLLHRLLLASSLLLPVPPAIQEMFPTAVPPALLTLFLSHG